MTPEQVEARFQPIESLLAKTEAIANSNARAIQALGDKLSGLIHIVANFENK